MSSRTNAAGLSLAILFTSSAAGAQYFDETLTADPAEVSSPERIHLELRVGPYEPSGRSSATGDTDRFDDFFGSDIGPLLAVEVDAIIYRLPNIASFGVGTGIGWAFYSGSAQAAATSGSTVQISEETDFTLYPIPILAFAKVDILPRLFNIPLVFTVKLGADLVFWQASTGGSRDAENLSVGFRWATQAALELDWFERRAARSLDEEFGINHTYLFFEIFGFPADQHLNWDLMRVGPGPPVSGSPSEPGDVLGGASNRRLRRHRVFRVANAAGGANRRGNTYARGF